MAVDVSQQRYVTQSDTVRQTNVAKLRRCLWSRLVKCIWRYMCRARIIWFWFAV